jgi:hypothetical protein
MKPGDARVERRKEGRRPASGWIELLFEDPEPLLVTGELLESSRQGFRAAHDSSRLLPGAEVEFRSEDRLGRARVIWTRILGGRRTSGFLLL